MRSLASLAFPGVVTPRVFAERPTDDPATIAVVSTMSKPPQDASVFASWDRLERWAPVLFVVLAFLFWGGRTLWDTSEARYGQAAFEMLHSGNWLLPQLAGKPHLTKPAFAYWCMAAGMKLFGVNAWGARFFLSVAFLATIGVVWQLAKVMGFDRRESLAAALIYATSAVPFAAGHTLTTDGFLVLWETLGVLAAWQVWQGEAEHCALWRWVFWGAFGLAFLTKGPPGWLPFLAIGALLWRRRDAARPRLFAPSGFLLFVVVSFLWYGLIVWHHPNLVEYFLKDEVYERVFTTVHQRNAPFWIYPPILLAGVGPWLVLWPWLARRVWRYRPGQGQRLADWQLFLLLWVALPLVVFTISKSRMVFYVLPLFVPLSLALGRVLIDELLPRLSSRAGWRQAARGVVLLWVAMLIVFTGGLDTLSPNRSLRSAALAFNEALAREPGSPQVYWLWAGHQRYSLGFYMERVIYDTDTLVTPAKPVPPPKAGSAGQPSPFYVTTEQGLAVIMAKSPSWAPGARFRVLAKAQRYVLFAVTYPSLSSGPGRAGEPPVGRSL